MNASIEGRPDGYHAGLTLDSVVDAAILLTEQRGLQGWSLRDLGRELGVAQSAIYHHVGGKDALSRHVSERVVASLSLPTEELDWDAWFRTLLLEARPVLLRYRGVAKWLLMHGPSFPAAAPIADAGIAVLQRGGFGDRTPLAYATLLNSALLTLMMGDERLIHRDDGPRDHAAMMTEFARLDTSSTGLRMLSERLVTPFAAGGAIAQDAATTYYRFVVETVLSGLRPDPNRMHPPALG